LEQCDVVILGAGPYGLSAAAHLASIPGLDVRTFGRPMSFWAEQMPRGMLLRSAYSASHLSAPDERFSLSSFETARGKTLNRPIPLEDFVEYGSWFQQQAAPDLDQRRITCINYTSGDFRILLEDETELRARRVVIAGGIEFFAHAPAEFSGLPRSLVTHSALLTEPGDFSKKRVAVVGAGQSALESAVLLAESGAEVEVIVRRPLIHFLGWSQRIHKKLGPAARLLYAPTDVGPMGISRLVAAPKLYRTLLPRSIQNGLRDFCRRPAGAHWLRNRLQAVRLTTERSVVSANAAGNQLRLKLNDGSERLCDHVILGTGYRVDVSKYPFLSQELQPALRKAHGFPVLNFGFESSIPGLYFTGAPAGWSFGPLMYFVAGADFTSRTIARSIKSAGRN
jgi:lysine/ornithine N-monooxygenase